MIPNGQVAIDDIHITGVEALAVEPTSKPGIAWGKLKDDSFSDYRGE